MGQARKRGSFEERKNKAIEEGRVKREPDRRAARQGYVDPDRAMMEGLITLLAGLSATRRLTRKEDDDGNPEGHSEER